MRISACLLPLLLLLTAVAGEVVDYFSCVYTFRPDKIGYACVEDPVSVVGGLRVGCDLESGRRPYIMTQQLKDTTKGEMYIWTMSRGCEYFSHSGCSEDTHYVTCVDICTSNACNGADQRHKDHVPLPYDAQVNSDEEVKVKVDDSAARLALRVPPYGH